MNNLFFRQETNKDFEGVFETHQLAFEQDKEARLVNALRNNLDVFIPELSIAATDNDNKVVGHILFTKIKVVQVNQSEIESLALAPLAIRPEFQNKGIGGQLIHLGLEKAKELNYKSVIVLGHKQYYPKFGFVPANKWNIISSYDVPSSHFMAIELVKEGLRNVSGLVKYAREFDDL